MAVMYALADSGYVGILATLSSNHMIMNRSCLVALDVLNTNFNRPDIPLGSP